MDVSPYHYEPVSCTIKWHGRELCKNSKEHFANVIGRKRGSLVGNFILQKYSNNRDVNQSCTATHVTKDKDSSTTCERSSASWSWRDTHKHQRKRTKAKQTRRMVQQKSEGSTGSQRRGWYLDQTTTSRTKAVATRHCRCWTPRTSIIWRQGIDWGSHTEKPKTSQRKNWCWTRRLNVD